MAGHRYDSDGKVMEDIVTSRELQWWWKERNGSTVTPQPLFTFEPSSFYRIYPFLSL